MTPLSAELVQRIRASGPISVAQFMETCLTHPTLGYYSTRDPLGVKGDFTTAPEVSQIFGELVGIWAVVAWQALGSPGHFNLIELGPGRGTLMADMLRASRVVPQFRDAADIHLVEISPVLRSAQGRAIGDSSRSWHAGIDTIPEGPCVIIANEFFDALPIRQFSAASGYWQERMIGIDATGELCWTLCDKILHLVSVEHAEGDVHEICPTAQDLGAEIAARFNRAPGALLAIDYGFGQLKSGDTFQAMKDHRFVDPLSSAGEADLTAHVDFRALGNVMKAAGAHVHPLLHQAMFLERMGIALRVDALCRAAPSRATDLLAAVARLMNFEPAGMGRLFKVFAASSAGLSLPAFELRDPFLEG